MVLGNERIWEHRFKENAVNYTKIITFLLLNMKKWFDNFNNNEIIVLNEGKIEFLNKFNNARVISLEIKWS